MRYFVLRGGKKYGPATIEQLTALLSEQRISLSTQVLTEDRKHQCTVAQIEEFSTFTENKQTGLTEVEEETRLMPPMQGPTPNADGRKTEALSQLLPKVEIGKIVEAIRDTTDEIEKRAKPELKKMRRTLQKWGIEWRIAKLVTMGMGGILLLLLMAIVIQKSPQSATNGASNLLLPNGKRIQFSAAPDTWSGLKLERGKTVILEGVVTKTGPGGATLLIHSAQTK